MTCHDRPAPATDFSCDACPSGYSGDGQSCHDIDDCAASPCGHGSCSDTGPNSYSCTCDTGYTFGGATCDEVFNCDAEESNDCDGNAECNHVGPGVHSCTCTTGFSGSGQSCADTDGCA